MNFRIAKLYGKIFSDSNFFLHSTLAEGDIAATKQHFNRSILERVRYLFTPTTTGI